MIILGIETASGQVSCALGGQEGVLAEFSLANDRRHAESLVPAIDFICKQAEIEISEISIVAVDIGPGLFTGMRVGISAAKAIAQARRVPMIGMSSLDLLAFPVRWSDRLIVSMSDARRGEVFYALYRQVSGGIQQIAEPAVGQPEDVMNELMARSEEALLVGDGARRYADLFREISGIQFASAGQAYPSAGALVELAQSRALREDFVQPHELEIQYLRKSDAEINWTAGVGQFGGNK